MIPIDKIKVINSRTRDESQFALNVQSIDAVGQIKDIRVNDKDLQAQLSQLLDHLEDTANETRTYFEEKIKRFVRGDELPPQAVPVTVETEAELTRHGSAGRSARREVDLGEDLRRDA